MNCSRRGVRPEETDVDVPLPIVALPHVHRRRASQREMNCSDAQPPHGVEREAIDVEHHRTPRRICHRQVEERCAGLLGVDADRRRGGAQPIGFGRRRQHEELVRRDYEIVDRIVGFIGQIVDHEFSGSTGQQQSFHQMLGNLSHEDVAAPAHEHSAHRPPQYQWSLASTTISPRFSIITPVYDPPLGAFLACIDGVLSQSLGDWEWCLVDDCSTRPEVRAVLDDLAARDPRIRVVHRATNGGIVAASNDALSMARGEFIALLDHDDRLVPTALERMAATIDSAAEVDYVYSDEAHVLADGRESAHFLKPDWSPERFRSSMYTCHLSALRREVVGEVGGFRTDFDGSQDHDLILRATELIASARAPGGAPSLPDVPLAKHFQFGITGNVVAQQCRRAGPPSRAGTVRSVEPRCPRGPRAGRGHVPPGARRARRHADHGCRAHACRGGATRPYRLAAAETIGALRTTHPTTRLVVAYPDTLPAELVALLDEAAGDRWELLPVHGDWSIAAALDRAFNAYPCEVLVSVAPGLVPRSDVTPDWLETLAGLAAVTRHGSGRFDDRR